MEAELATPRIINKQNVMNISITFFLVMMVVSKLSLTIPKAKADPLPNACTKPSKLVQFIVSRVGADSNVKPRDLTCDELVQIDATNHDSIEVTTGRKNGESVICVGFSRDKPCQIVLAYIVDNVDSTATLTRIFTVKESRRNVQLNETVERLFIKPAALIR